MKQSANPAARVRHYTRTISTSAQNASIWLLTAAAPSDSIIRVLRTNSFTYLLTYLYDNKHRLTRNLAVLPGTCIRARVNVSIRSVVSRRSNDQRALSIIITRTQTANTAC